MRPDAGRRRIRMPDRRDNALNFFSSTRSIVRAGSHSECRLRASTSVLVVSSSVSAQQALVVLEARRQRRSKALPMEQIRRRHPCRHQAHMPQNPRNRLRPSRNRTKLGIGTLGGDLGLNMMAIVGTSANGRSGDSSPNEYDPEHANQIASSAGDSMSRPKEFV